MTKYIQPPRNEECEWRSGPPPEIGWWPADWWVVPRPECRLTPMLVGDEMDAAIDAAMKEQQQ